MPPATQATAGLTVALVLLVAACTATADPGGQPRGTSRPGEPGLTREAGDGPHLAVPTASTTVLAGDSAGLAAQTSAHLFASAPVAVLADAADSSATATAASVAVTLQAPLLLVSSGASPTSATATADTATSQTTATSGTAPSEVTPNPQPARDELERLGVAEVVTFGSAAAAFTAAFAAELGVDAAQGPEPTDLDGLAELLGQPVAQARRVAEPDLVAAVADLQPGRVNVLAVTSPSPSPPTPGSDSSSPGARSPARSSADASSRREAPATGPGGVVVLATHDQASVAAVATARAAGATVLVGMEPDPRSDPAVVARLAAQQPRQVLAVGRQFGSVENLERRLAIAATGVELPGGGQVLFPHRRMIAMYGRPGTPSLGVLGEQSLEATIRRAKRLAGSYTGVSDTTVIPAFEVITTLAAADAGRDGDYSSETAVEDLRPWIDAARTAGIYVVLDLQPGRTSFLTQARRYEELLAEPHVGLALDPEWRLKPGQRHLRQIGSVDVSEVNAVAGWLAGLTRQHRLPQKLLILHQFRLSMIPGRSRVDTSHDELAILIHADGNGTPGQKHATYRALTADAPEGVWWGWKNFYDEDSPTFTPAQTMEVNPPPLFVSYQ